MRALKPVRRGWTNGDRAVAAKRTFSHGRQVLSLQLRSWANSRHPNKNKHWIAQQYGHGDDSNGWIATDQQNREPPCGNIRTRLSNARSKDGGGPAHTMGMCPLGGNGDEPMRGSTGCEQKPLQNQQRKCRWCGLLFQGGNFLEVDHITPKGEGARKEISNRCALYRHCHDQRHARSVVDASDKGSIVEKLDNAKGSCPVLKLQKGDNSSA